MDGRSVTQKLIDSHQVEAGNRMGEEIAIRIDQTLTQDATGTMVMLELEAMGLERVATALSVQYVDHNLLQQDHRNPDDHVFLQTACEHFGIWFSPPGNGVSHPVHMERFGKPGKTLLGADSHTCAAGSLGRTPDTPPVLSATLFIHMRQLLCRCYAPRSASHRGCYGIP